MIIEVTKDDCQNVKVALLALAKSPQVDEEGMKILLTLSQKFNFQEEKKETQV